MIEPDVAGVPPVLVEPLRAGKLEQVCPRRCRQGWRRTGPIDSPEAAGWTCSACDAETGPADWFSVHSEARRRASALGHAAKAERRSPAKKTASPAALSA